MADSRPMADSTHVFMTPDDIINVTDPDLRSLLLSILSTYSDVYMMIVYGSRVYGTARPDSDYDVYVVTNDPTVIDNDIDIKICPEIMVDGAKHDITVVSLDKFRHNIAKCDVATIECVMYYYLYCDDGNAYIHTTQTSCGMMDDFIQSFDDVTSQTAILKAMRKTFSGTSSNSYVKARKKVVDARHDDGTIDKAMVKVGLKSMYHSLRIAVYGVLFAKIIKGEMDIGDLNFGCTTRIWTTLLADYSNDPSSITVGYLKKFYKDHMKNAGSDLTSSFCSDGKHLLSTLKMYLPK